ncbi:hypothetical protein ACUY3K_07260 [Corynebacterium uberis]|uniref:hypothetical protein n=1 Tax=Corynebacterium TaxID=1716 RepID=UPI001D0A9BF6|nr:MULTISPECIES: hypothetical protein [Corynebacterium]MCZ9308891.1 hypothetical protein [Corynebacterium sp. c6VSa_13]UDL74635.1 hypothetical protein LH391_05460 [Corynebacterium uberis]UDL76531.1 hypothetical protein LH393_03945 [Corynebacterium uberis]UDL78743.1 hypothetical protein LH394_03930 [Corynebacterium uberis]UDL81022.1 hypothetical protein LH392_04355 [Corynebacterium uberis]
MDLDHFRAAPSRKIPLTREIFDYFFQDDPLPHEVVLLLFDKIKDSDKRKILHDARYCFEWDGMDYALFLAAENNWPVPDDLINRIEDEMNKYGEYCGLPNTIPRLRAQNAERAGKVTT